MSDYISHEGILGMKWGKRNGPPYPLEQKQKSKEEIIRDIDVLSAYKRLSEFDDRELQQLTSRMNAKRSIASEYNSIKESKIKKIKNAVSTAINGLAAVAVVRDYVKDENDTKVTDVLKALNDVVNSKTPSQNKKKNKSKKESDDDDDDDEEDNENTNIRIDILNNKSSKSSKKGGGKQASKMGKEKPPKEEKNTGNLPAVYSSSNSYYNQHRDFYENRKKKKK